MVYVNVVYIDLSGAYINALCWLNDPLFFYCIVVTTIETTGHHSIA